MKQVYNVAFGGCIAIGTVGRVAAGSFTVVVSDFDAHDTKSIRATTEGTDARMVSFFMVKSMDSRRDSLQAHFTDVPNETSLQRDDRHFAPGGTGSIDRIDHLH